MKNSLPSLFLTMISIASFSGIEISAQNIMDRETTALLRNAVMHICYPDLENSCTPNVWDWPVQISPGKKGVKLDNPCFQASYSLMQSSHVNPTLFNFSKRESGEYVISLGTRGTVWGFSAWKLEGDEQRTLVY